MKTAGTFEEIKPLIDLCKTGKLFEVQEWIASGKPVNLLKTPEKKGTRQGPLQIAMEMGFHSLVEVLLDGGANVEESRYRPLRHAVRKCRLDLAKLLVKKGADIHSVDITDVFESWNPELVEYFIEQGADLENGNPLAWALCNKIRPALGLLKRYKERFPSFQEQANIALRHHCWEGNLKWVSLMLWAGADPYTKGADSPEEKPDQENDNNALELAAFHGNLDIFKLKAIRIDPKSPDAPGLLKNACYAENSNLLRWFLEKGLSPREWDDKGSSLIHFLLRHMSFDWNFSPFDGGRRKEKDIDSPRSRENIKMIHLLVRHGAIWKPESDRDINEVRRSLLKMTPDYTFEFAWIMSKYSACSRKCIENLLRTAPIRILIQKNQARIDELLAALR